VDRDIIKKIFLDLDTGKSCGDDGIANAMLKMVAHTIDGPLAVLFQRLVDLKTFPDCWKQGTIVPVFKNRGSRNSVSNYRPVTLLNTISKVFERAIYNSICIE
jgi:hypothetical protein